MEDLNGTYIWHYVDNESKIEGLDGETQCLVCMEVSRPKGSAWHLQLAYWYKKGDKLTIYETNGTPHRFDIDKDGFYVVNDMSDGKHGLIYRIFNVRYWTTIEQPGVNPDDVLTIV